MEQSQALKGRKELWRRCWPEFPSTSCSRRRNRAPLLLRPFRAGPLGSANPGFRFTVGYDPCGASRLVLDAANSPGDNATYRATSHAKWASSGAISFSQARRTAAGDPGVEMTTFPP